MATAEEATQQAPRTAADDANVVVDQEARVTPRRFFTIPGRDPFESLLRLMLGALIPGRDGGLLNARLRQRDPERRRAVGKHGGQ